ncbi:MAG TPA: sensor domain-containing diguanylate cyclase [Selenomonadales bacterium]|nr:sensor domain-containing diguanylate cyclase [Selenomonadales bacterium]
MDAGCSISFLEKMFEGCYQVDPQRRILFWNAAAESLTGYPGAAVLGKRCQDNLLQHVSGEGEALCEGRCPLAQTLEDGQYREVLVYLRHRSGHRVPVMIRVLPVYDEAGRITGATELFIRHEGAGRDQQIRELARRAFIDSITGLPSRQYLESKLQVLLSPESLNTQGAVGLLMLEVGNLKEVNDTFGSEVGNRMLKVAGQTLLANTPKGGVAGRWYGGSFVLLTDIDRKGVMLNWGTKLKALIEQSSVPECDEVRMKVNAGGIIQENPVPLEMAVRRLEDQLRQSRLSGTNKICIGE